MHPIGSFLHEIGSFLKVLLARTDLFIGAFLKHVCPPALQARPFARLVAPDAGMLSVTLGMAQRAATLSPQEADYVSLHSTHDLLRQNLLHAQLACAYAICSNRVVLRHRMYQVVDWSKPNEL